MSVSVLIPTYNRARFSELVSYNIVSQDYPVDEVIILDDGSEELLLNVPCKVSYHRCSRCSIGSKRNRLLKLATTKYLAFMDDDDIYMPTYLSHSITTLEENKKEIVGSSNMLFVFANVSYEKGSMSCVYNSAIHEATMVMTKKYAKKANKFKTKGYGEGIDFMKGMGKFMTQTDISKCMICVVHNHNSVSKEKWFKKNRDDAWDCNIETHRKILMCIDNI